MNKLKSIIQYECMTSFKYIWIFYAIQYAIVGLITLIIGIVSGSFENVGTNCLEINTLFFVSILGALGFKEDFKTLIQNGFTRKYIFIAALSLFSFMSGIMAFIDTVVGNFLHYFNKDYTSLYSGIYGYDNIVMNWLWLFLVYVSPIQIVGVTDNLLIVHKSFTVLAILTVVNCVRLCYLSLRKGQCLLLCWLGRESGRTPLEFEALL